MIDIQTFLSLLFLFSVVTSLIVQVIKKFIEDKKHRIYNIIAFIVAIIVGCIGTSVYYIFNDLPFNLKNIIFALLLGLASGICSQLGFDKVKQAMLQLGITQK